MESSKKTDVGLDARAKQMSADTLASSGMPPFFGVKKQTTGTTMSLDLQFRRSPIVEQSRRPAVMSGRSNILFLPSSIIGRQ
jgi:hypothetical protein